MNTSAAAPPRRPLTRKVAREGELAEGRTLGCERDGLPGGPLQPPGRQAKRRAAAQEELEGSVGGGTAAPTQGAAAASEPPGDQPTQSRKRGRKADEGGAANDSAEAAAAAPGGDCGAKAAAVVEKPGSGPGPGAPPFGQFACGSSAGAGRGAAAADGAVCMADGPPGAGPPPLPAKKKQRQAWGGCGAAAASGPSMAMESGLRAQGYSHVGGTDEAGRGPLAGPVVAAVCVVPEGADVPAGVNDSKAMSEEERERVYGELTADPRIKWAVCVVDHTEIDRVNILQASLGAMRSACQSLLACHPAGLDFLLVDGNRMPQGLPVPAQTVVKGDATCTCIAAASIIAKVTRDRLMLQLDAQYPQYGFAQHKGYGVPAHMAAIRAHGPSEVHRRSFEPVKGMTGWSRQPAGAGAAAATGIAAQDAPAAAAATVPGTAPASGPQAGAGAAAKAAVPVAPAAAADAVAVLELQPANAGGRARRAKAKAKGG